MNTHLKITFALVALLGFGLSRLNAQGYIVTNGVVFGGFISDLGYSIEVKNDPINSHYTGFLLEPTSKTQPTTYTNTFLFNPVVDVSVRVFFVSALQPITSSTVLSGSYVELNSGSYVFENGVPFYLALYTGNQNYYPINGVYSDPLFGWVRLVNNQGAIQMLGGALEYGGAGIYAGTQTIINVSEPSTLALAGLAGAVLIASRRKIF